MFSKAALLSNPQYESVLAKAEEYVQTNYLSPDSEKRVLHVHNLS
jgi:hypothetical protein